MVVLGQNCFFSGKSGYIWVKVVVIGQKLFYSGKSCCNRAKWLNSVKNGCILAIMVFAGKVVVFGQKWLYSGKSGCIRSKLVVFG